MSVRHYCDVCGGEMLPQEHDRVRRRLDRVTVEVMVCLDKTWNTGHICHRCVIRAILEGEVIGSEESYVVTRDAARRRIRPSHEPHQAGDAG